MEEPASWKGHSFTLLVFGGIVVLCSIFFVLGMLVGRSHGQRLAEVTAEAAAPAKVPAVEGPALIFQKTPEPSLEEVDPPLVVAEAAEAAAPPRQERPLPPAIVPEPPEARPSSQKLFLQVAALKGSGDAEKKLKEVKGKGFDAFILSPASGGGDVYYRLQLGPYTSLEEAEIVRRQLASAGYKEAFIKK